MVKDDDSSPGGLADNPVQVLRVLWSEWLTVLSVTAIITLAAAAGGWLSPKTYQAATIVSPMSASGSGGQLAGLASGGASPLNGLASLAGISLGGDSKKFESLAVLQSEALTEKFISENNLLPVLYWKRWDARLGRWKPDQAGPEPTLWTANQYFKKRIRIVATDTKTGLSTLTISWTDPKVASQWANGLVKLTNDYLRDQAIEESERNVAYLREQASKIDEVGIKQVIYTILQSEISKIMLARGNDQYALKVIDPAFAPEKPSSLSAVVWVVSGFIGGLLISSVFVLWKRGFLRG
jgi:Chain length determinant protein